MELEVDLLPPDVLPSDVQLPGHAVRIPFEAGRADDARCLTDVINLAVLKVNQVFFMILRGFEKVKQ